MIIKLNKLLILAFLNLLLLSTAFAQATDNGNLTGTVFTSGGSSIPDVTVTIRHPDSCSERRLITNEEGRWTAYVLRLGEHELTFEASGYKKIKETVIVEGNITKTFDKTLEAADTEPNSDSSKEQQTRISTSVYREEGGLKGTVFDPVGGGITNAFVTVKNIDNCWHNTVRTNTNGRWIMKGLSYGKYEVTYKAAGFETAKETLTINTAAIVKANKVLNIDAANPNTADSSETTKPQ